MELKFRKSEVALLSCLGSNRTFMELKCNSRLRCSDETDVLIVPLWN